MPRYNYNNIIIIATNVVLVQFFSARFVDPARSAAILSFFYTS